MDPFTLLAIGGTAANVFGKLMGSSSQSAMDAAQSQAYLTQAKGFDTKVQVDDLNTGMLGNQADVAHMGVDFAASRERTELGKIAESGRQTLEAQRSYFAGGNLDPSFGSPLLVQAMTAGRVATDMDIAKASFAIDKANALTTEANLRGQAAGSAGQSQSDALSASAARISAASAAAKGDADMTAGYFGAATSLLSGAASISKFGSFGSGLNLSGGGGFSLTTTGGLY